MNHGVEVSHHFGYWKRILIPAGVWVGQHRHKFGHWSLLVSGHVAVKSDYQCVEHKAPALIFIEAGKLHNVHAFTDVEWLCLHETDERDVSKIDKEIIE